MSFSTWILYFNSDFNPHCANFCAVQFVQTVIKKCPSDCEDIRYSVNKQVIPIDLASYCKEYHQDGAALTKKLLQSDANVPDYYPLVDNFYSMDQNDKSNNTQNDNMDTTL